MQAGLEHRQMQSLGEAVKQHNESVQTDQHNSSDQYSQNGGNWYTGLDPYRSGHGDLWRDIESNGLSAMPEELTSCYIFNS
jgi:hypothetical protein